ncbi:MAG TPA: T9SS type A sorting domain-containing protein [Candidatus Eisenbacteria bacterium]|jgi:hypothetical protein
MKRIGISSLAWSAVLTAVLAGAAFATPLINGATIETRTFNDCGLSTLTTSNSYPASIQITDVMDPLCVGFANLHSFSFSADGGATAAAFDNNSNFRLSADFKIEGPGEGEGGLRLSPWYGQYVDGRFMANATTGEIACFGGALPFYSFTVGHGITYTKGTTIHFELTYKANDLSSVHPATIQYRVVYNGNTYDSPELDFGEQNEAECDPHGLWGMLNDGRAGGYFQPRANTGASLTATWSNIQFECLPADGTPVANGATVETRTFNDCGLSTLTTSNNYPASIQITDVMDPLCVGFANLHSFSFSEDGGATAAVFDNNASFRFGADFKIEGPGEGEGGLRISPWYGQYVDGRFMANATTGEIACFGGALPFYSFTVGHGITYTKGTTIRLEVAYNGRHNTEADPAIIQYRVIYNGTTYDSPVLAFGKQNAGECPHGLWGMLNDGRAGGYFQPRANTGASLTATWSNITYSPCANTAEITFSPEVLNLGSKAKYVTVSIEPEAGFAASDIDVSSLRLNGSVAVASGAPTTIGDADGDGTPDLTVKFDRSSVGATLSPGSAVTISITGQYSNCDCFSGTDVIRVKNSSLAAPVAGSVLGQGSQVEVRWDPDGLPQAVDLISSFDDGATWRIEAQGMANNGSRLWTVPSVTTDQLRLAVAAVNRVDATGIVTDAELGESGTFRISATVGVGGGATVAFAMRKIAPNPTHGEFTVDFSLPNGKPATLAVYDVSGRQVAVRQVGSLGAGQHSVTFGKQMLAAGVYHVRLTQDGRSLTRRASVIE